MHFKHPSSLSFGHHFLAAPPAWFPAIPIPLSFPDYGIALNASVRCEEDVPSSPLYSLRRLVENACFLIPRDIVIQLKELLMEVFSAYEWQENVSYSCIQLDLPLQRAEPCLEDFILNAVYNGC